MKTLKLYVILAAISISLLSFAGNPNKNYTVKYIEDKSGDCYPMNINIKVTPTKIYAENTSSGSKYWDCQYLGKIEKTDKGVTFYYHKYYLTNKQVYFIISDDKIMKYRGTFYHIILFDGEIQYAL